MLLFCFLICHKCFPNVTLHLSQIIFHSCILFHQQYNFFDHSNKGWTELSHIKNFQSLSNHGFKLGSPKPEVVRVLQRLGLGARFL